MAEQLKDVRWKITPLAWVYIEAEHRTTGRDQGDIAREILDGWAQQKHAAAIEAQKLLKVEGIVGSRGESERVVEVRRKPA